MKLNKLFLGLLGLSMTAFTACSDDDDYQRATVSGNQVYFSVDLPAIQEISKSASSFSVPLYRQETSQDITVNLVAKQPDNSIYNIPSSVSFEAGQSETLINVTYNPDDVVYGDYEQLTIALADSSLSTPYGAISYNFSAGVTAWVSYGTAKYRDDMMNHWWNTGTPEYNVEVEKSIIEEGMYRLVYPYGEAYPHNDPGDWDDSKTYYMTINATDPDFVWVENSEQGLDWGYGIISMRSYVEYFLAGGNSLDVIKANRPDLFGKLENGVITMPAGSMLISMTGYNDGSWYISAANGAFRVLLPGAVLADYSAEVEAKGVFTDLGGNVFASAELTLGADASEVKAVVVSADDDAEAVADAIAAGELEATDVEAGSINVPIPDDLTGELQIVVVVLGNGEVKSIATANFEYYGGGANPWNSLGTAYYTEDFVLPLFGNNPLTYEVEIEENNEKPGLLRIKKAYAYLAAGFRREGGENDILIHAENPNGVYFLKQSTGLDLGYGDMSIVSYGGDDIEYYSNYSTEQVIEAHPGDFGKLENGVITLPLIPREDQEGNPVYDDEGNQLFFSGYLYLGEDGYYAGTNGAFKLVLPGASDQEVAQARSRAKASDFAVRLNANSLRGLRMPARQVKRRIIDEGAGLR